MSASKKPRPKKKPRPEKSDCHIYNYSEAVRGSIYYQWGEEERGRVLFAVCQMLADLAQIPLDARETYIFTLMDFIGGFILLTSFRHTTAPRNMKALREATDAVREARDKLARLDAADQKLLIEMTDYREPVSDLYRALSLIIGRYWDDWRPKGYPKDYGLFCMGYILFKMPIAHGGKQVPFDPGMPGGGRNFEKARSILQYLVPSVDLFTPSCETFKRIRKIWMSISSDKIEPEIAKWCKRTRDLFERI